MKIYFVPKHFGLINSTIWLPNKLDYKYWLFGEGGMFSSLGLSGPAQYKFIRAI